VRFRISRGSTPRGRRWLGDLKYPLISDLTKKISADYGVLLDSGISLRGLFVIDQKGIIRAITITTYRWPECGRSDSRTGRASTFREARRSVPGELEARRCNHRHEEREGVLRESSEVVQWLVSVVSVSEEAEDRKRSRLFTDTNHCSLHLRRWEHRTQEARRQVELGVKPSSTAATELTRMSSTALDRSVAIDKSRIGRFPL